MPENCISVTFFFLYFANNIIVELQYANFHPLKFNNEPLCSRAKSFENSSRESYQILNLKLAQIHQQITLHTHTYCIHQRERERA